MVKQNLKINELAGGQDIELSTKKILSNIYIVQNIPYQMDAYLSGFVCIVKNKV